MTTAELPLLPRRTPSTWLDIPDDTDYSMQNFPLGVYSLRNKPGRTPRCASRLGNYLIDLSVLEEARLFAATDDKDGHGGVPGLASNVFRRSTFNAFMEHPKPVWIAFRRRLVALFATKGEEEDGREGTIVVDDRLRTNASIRKAALIPIDDNIVMHLPIQIGDYTDFYSSREHATNCGIIFRGSEQPPLLPNWLRLPVGYHGRSSTVCVSGTPVRRPCGQIQRDPNDPNQGSVYGACKLLDFELEMAAVVGGCGAEQHQHQQDEESIGRRLTIEEAKDRIFGYVLMNDWSARDIQKWEYVPLGPFTSKNFATTVAPWIVTTAALDPYFVAPTSAVTQNDPIPLPYLRDPTYSSYDVQLSVAIRSSKHKSASSSSSQPLHPICQSNFRNMYWNSVQQLVHHTVTGCRMKAGDLLGSGTISGSTQDSFGSMLELSWKGTREVAIGPGGDETRKFLLDGDTVIMRGVCTKPPSEGIGRVGFGECIGTILPAIVGDATTTATASGQGHDATIASSCTSIPSNSRYTDFKLYGHWRSSSSWRVRVQLAAKQIQYTTVSIDPMHDAKQASTTNLSDKNPMGQIPVLELADSKTGKQIRLTQSVVIIDFVDRVFPDRHSLIPQNDPLMRAQAMEMVEVINSGTQPLQNIAYLHDLETRSEGKINSQEQGQRCIEKGLQALEKLVVQRRQVLKEEEVDSSATSYGPYCMGTFSPTIADAYMVPQIYNAGGRYNVDVKTVCPTLVEIYDVCLKHPWFVASHPSNQPDAPSKG